MGRIRVKICGVTDSLEALAIAEAGTDWIGLNFHRPSPRFVEIEAARAIVRALPASCRPVGLFVDRPPAEVMDTARQVGLEIVQLHGDEPPEDLAALRGLEIVRAFRLRDESSIDDMMVYLERCERLGRSPDAVGQRAWVPAVKLFGDLALAATLAGSTEYYARAQLRF